MIAQVVAALAAGGMLPHLPLGALFAVLHSLAGAWLAQATPPTPTVLPTLVPTPTSAPDVQLPTSPFGWLVWVVSVIIGAAGLFVAFTQIDEWWQNRKERRAKKPEPAPADTFDPTNPYPGIDSFQEADNRWFFGRDPQIREIIIGLETRRFVLLTGPSGVGKSSLLHAGLLPRLDRTEHWPHLLMEPGAAPVAQLTDLLGGDPAQSAAVVAAHLRGLPSSSRLLIVVDQGEQLFTQTPPDQRAPFLNLLHGLIRQPRCVALLAMRYEFLSSLEALNQDWVVRPDCRIDLELLDEAGLRQAIEEPARHAGATIEPDLVNQLLRDAAHDPNTLPLLQITLRRMWNDMIDRKEQKLKLALYSGDNRRGLADAVTEMAEQALLPLDDRERAIAMRSLLRLVQFGEGHPDTRRRVPRADLAAEGAGYLLEPVLDKLRDGKLITFVEQPAGMVDLAHDVLINGWPDLRRYIDQHRDAEQKRRIFEERAAVWEHAGRNTAGLLNGLELADAAQWRATSAGQEVGTSVRLHELIDASQMGLDAAKLRRRQHVVALQGALLAAQARNTVEDNPELALLLAERAMTGLLKAQVDLDELPQVEDTLRLALYSSAVRHCWPLQAGGVQAALYSLDGAWIAAACADGVIRLRPTPGLDEPAVSAWPLELRGHQGPVNGLDYHPQGARLVSAGHDGTARVWDTANQRELLRIAASNGPLRSAAYSPDGAYILTAAADGNSSIWNATTGQEEAQLPDHMGPLNAARYSPDGRRIVTASADRSARILIEATAEVVATLLDDKAGFSCATWSPDGSAIVTGNASGLICIWSTPESLAGNQHLAQPSATLTGHNGRVNSVAFSADGRSIISASSDGTLRLWDVATRQCRQVMHSGDGGSWSAVFHPSCPAIVSADATGSVRQWSAEGYERQTIHLPADQSLRDKPVAALRYAVYSPDGLRLATVDSDGALRLWDAVSGKLEGTGNAEHSPGAWCAAWQHDGQRIVSGGAEALLRVWNANGAALDPLPLRQLDAVYALAYSPDGQWLAVAGEGEYAFLYRVEGDALTLKRTLAADRLDPTSSSADSSFSVRAVAFNRSGSKLATAGLHGMVRIWAVETGQEERVIPTTHGQLFGVAFAPDDTAIATSGADKTVCIWDLAHEQPPRILRGHNKSVRHVVYSPDGREILSAADDGAFTWSPTRSQLRSILRGHTDWVYAANYSADGRYIMTSSADGAARQYLASCTDLCALATARRIRDFTAREQLIYSLAMMDVLDGADADNGLG